MEHLFQKLDRCDERIEYLAAQCGRLFTLYKVNKYRINDPDLEFTEVLISSWLTPDHEGLAIMILGKCTELPSTETADISEGFVPVPDEAAETFSNYAAPGTIDDDQIDDVLVQALQCDDLVAANLRQAWPSFS